jgi:hypothetical protein
MLTFAVAIQLIEIEELDEISAANKFAYDKTMQVFVT